MNKKEIGIKISTIRKELGLTQKELAEKLHVTDKTVSKWETGIHFPDIAIMEELSKNLGITVVELLGLETLSVEKVVDEMMLISIEEKNKIVKELRFRGWLTVVLSCIILVGLIYASKILADNNIFGLPQVATSGLSGILGVIISNGIFSIIKANKLVK